MLMKCKITKLLWKTQIKIGRRKNRIRKKLYICKSNTYKIKEYEYLKVFKRCINHFINIYI